jgi:putative DNA primase/helicase
MSGILNWALDGLERLLKNGRFTGTQSARAIMERYERNADPIKFFLEERTIKDGNGFVPKDDLWEAFYTYCQENNMPCTYSDRSFAAAIGKLLPDGQMTINNERGVRVWLTIKLIECATASRGTLNSLRHTGKSVRESKERRVNTLHEEAE